MKKVVFIGALLLIIGLVGAGWMLYQGVDFKATGKSFRIQKSHDSSKIKNIHIINDNALIEIDSSNSNQIEATLTGSDKDHLVKDLSLTVKGETIQIKEKDVDAPNSFLDSFSIRQPLKLKIYLPQKMYEQLNIQSENGSIAIRNFKGNKIVGTTENADIQLLKTEGAFILESENGSIQVESLLGFKGNSQAKVVNGNVDIETVTEPTSLKIDLQSKYGNINFNYPTKSNDIRKDDNYGTDQRVQGTFGNPVPNQPSIKAYSETGDVTLGSK
jgi:DUF4097 and DUF4098 domain-containing protein YvlB